MGFDFDDGETFVRLRDFLVENPVFELDIAVLTPMPGTRLYKRLKKEGRLYPEKWDDYTWYHINFKPENLEPGEIKRGIKWVFDEYSKDGVIAKRSILFKSIEERIPDLEGRNVR